LIDIDNIFNNDVIMPSLVANRNSSTVHIIVNWVTTADGCFHTADTTQLDFAVDTFVFIPRSNSYSLSLSLRLEWYNLIVERTSAAMCVVIARFHHSRDRGISVLDYCHSWDKFALTPT